MTDTGSGSDSDTQFLAAVGRILLDLAGEWQNVRHGNLNVEVEGLMRDVYGALALQLGVQAIEVRGGGLGVDMLRQKQAGLRSELADTVAKIKQ